MLIKINAIYSSYHSNIPGEILNKSTINNNNKTQKKTLH